MQHLSSASVSEVATTASLAPSQQLLTVQQYGNRAVACLSDGDAVYLVHGAAHGDQRQVPPLHGPSDLGLLHMQGTSVQDSGLPLPPRPVGQVHLRRLLAPDTAPTPARMASGVAWPSQLRMGDEASRQVPVAPGEAGMAAGAVGGSDRHLPAPLPTSSALKPSKNVTSQGAADPSLPQPISLLSVSPDLNVNFFHGRSFMLATAAGPMLRVFDIPAEVQCGAPTSASLAPQSACELLSPGGCKWMALAWHPEQPGILAVASQACMCICLCSSSGEGGHQQQQQSPGQPLQLTVLAFLPVSRPGNPSVITLAWQSSSSNKLSTLSGSWQGGVDGLEVLMATWGSDVRLFQWGARDGRSRSGSHQSVLRQDFWSAPACSETNLPIGLPGPPRALVAGPEGSFLCTTDAPLCLSAPLPQPAAAVGGPSRPLISEVTTRTLAQGPGLGGGQLSGQGGRLQPAIAALHSAAGDEEAVCFTDMMDLHGKLAVRATGILGTLMGGLGVEQHLPQQLEPQLRQPHDLSGSGCSPAAEAMRVVGNFAFKQTQVPSSFILPTPSATAQLCLFHVERRCLSGSDLHPQSSQDLDQRPASCRVDLMVPRPDLLHCCGDLVLVGSTCGPAAVQIFRIYRSEDKGVGVGETSSTSASSLGTLPSLQLVSNLALSAASLDTGACRLRGLLLQRTGTPHDQMHGSAVQILALLGGHQQAQAGMGLPLFMLVSKAGPGSSAARLAPLLYCTFAPPGLLTAADDPCSTDAADCTASARSFGRTSSASCTVSVAKVTECLGAGVPARSVELGLTDKMIQAVSLLVGDLERRMEERMERMEDSLDGRMEDLEFRIEERMGRAEAVLDERMVGRDRRMEERMGRNEVLLDGRMGVLEICLEDRIGRGDTLLDRRMDGRELRMEERMGRLDTQLGARMQRMQLEIQQLAERIGEPEE